MIPTLDILGYNFSLENFMQNEFVRYSFHIVTAIILAFLFYWITKKVLLKVVSKFIQKTKTHWDDHLLKRNFFSKAAYFAPAILIHYYLSYFPSWTYANIVQNILTIYILIITLLLINIFLDSVNDIYMSYKISKNKPIKGFIQIIKIIAVIIISIIIVSLLMEKSPQALLTGLGAFAAIIMLVFKDSILGFVAGINLTANNMLHIGDWIVMPSCNADGEVTEISLTVVKVQNWDKTIVTIPTYKLMSESFTNWRGMEESGGRRIKRHINIDMKSIKFLSNDEITKFKDFKLLNKYITKQCEEIKKHNKNEIIPTNQKRLTNIGTFRKYLEEYLSYNKLIHDDMIFMVRQLQPTEKGIPIEVYGFSKIQDWKNYEGLQSDIFDHIMAIIPEFGLKVFQFPSLDEIKLIQ